MPGERWVQRLMHQTMKPERLYLPEPLGLLLDENNCYQHWLTKEGTAPPGPYIAFKSKV